MNSILSVAAVVSIVVAVGTVSAARSVLRTTALMAAWRWALAAGLMWLVAIIVMGVTDGPDTSAELLWFATALVGLCPAIAVLGARRPGAGAWTCFVLIPLLAVLGWPALTVWVTGTDARTLRLETPQLIGFGLVLMMGAGNYVGTKFWSSAMWYAIALCLLIAPLSELTPVGMTPFSARAAGSCALGLAAVFALVQRVRSRPLRSPLDRLWEDYRNTFGIVWARRLQDRLNAVARQQSWPVSVSPMGFHWDAATMPPLREKTTAKIEQSLRWMLRRFVSPEWIDQRLTRHGSGESG